MKKNSNVDNLFTVGFELFFLFHFACFLSLYSLLAAVGVDAVVVAAAATLFSDIASSCKDIHTHNETKAEKSRI